MPVVTDTEDAVVTALLDALRGHRGHAPPEHTTPVLAPSYTAACFWRKPERKFSEQYVLWWSW